MIEVVVFDLDDTLFSEDRFVMSGFHAVADWLAAEHGAVGFFEMAERVYHAGERRRVFNRALEQLNGNLADEDLVPFMVDVYRNHWPSITLFEDARWAIDHYRSRKKTGIITDGFLKTQQNKVLSLGIESKFDAIIYSDAFGRDHWKPSETPYRELMRSLSCSGNECVYVADNPAKDFVTARKLGWQTVHVKREGVYHDVVTDKDHAADVEITSLEQLKDIID